MDAHTSTPVHMGAHPNTPVHKYAYSLDETARLLSISRRLLCTLIDDGTVRTVPLGTRRVVPATEFARLLQPQEQSA